MAACACILFAAIRLLHCGTEQRKLGTILATFEPSSKCTLTNIRNETLELVSGQVAYIPAAIGASMKIIILDALGDVARYTFKFESGLSCFGSIFLMISHRMRRFWVVGIDSSDGVLSC